VAKKVKYSSKTRHTTVAEPLPVVGSLPLLARLRGMSYIEVSDTRLPGKKLQEVQEQTSLSAQDMAGIMGVSKSKYYELLQLDTLSEKAVDALADFAALWQKGLDAFDGEVELLNEWLARRNTNLGNVRPKELLSSRLGRRELEKAFLRIEHSTYG